MSWSERFQIALRQTLDRGRGLSSFLSRLSVAGLVLAVALLLAVLSVMNGFESQMRERILGLLPHVTVRGYADAAVWQDRRKEILSLGEVSSAMLFADADVLMVRGQSVRAARVLGVESDSIARYGQYLTPAVDALGPEDLLLGAPLAARLQLVVGDRLTLILPGAVNERQTSTPLLGRFRIAGLLDSGTELDEAFAVTSREAMGKLLGDPGRVSGMALQLDDLFAAPQLRRSLDRSLPPIFYVSDWTIAQGNLYAAIRLSRNIVTLLLVSIIAVAAFNVVSSLVLVVTDRRQAIAMLNALGASRRDIQWIFLLQGGLIGVLGAAMGTLLGLALAAGAPTLARLLEGLLGLQLLNTDVYPLAFLPVDIRLGDIALVNGVAVILCLLAAVIPARRAARIPVARLLASWGS